MRIKIRALHRAHTLELELPFLPSPLLDLGIIFQVLMVHMFKTETYPK